jgi:uncharacterized alpha-E superfamily protein
MLSRVADSLYWLSRYIERAENNARILDVNIQLTLDSEHAGAAQERADWLPILATLEDLAQFDQQYDALNAATVCEHLTFSPANPNSILSCVAAARENARTVREYISSEMWERINSLYLWLNSDAARELYRDSAIDLYRQIVDHSHQFNGTTDATLTQVEGWNFLQVGKFLERADAASRIIDLKYHILLPHGEQVGGTVDNVQWQAVLKSCSGFEAYQKLYTGVVSPASVAEFLILHESFPRSILFCVDHLDAALHRISGSERTKFANTAERLSGRLLSDLHYATVADIFASGLHQWLDSLQIRLIEVGATMRSQFCTWQ